MALHLVVKKSFLSYQVGDIIIDSNTVTSILGNPDYAGFVVPAGTSTGSSGGGGGGSPAPITLSSNRGAISLDGTTISVNSDNVLYVVPNSDTFDQLVAVLGYTPANRATIGSANGIAGLDGNAKVPLSQLPTAVAGAINYVGTWDALANAPGLLSGVGTKGAYYKVSTAGNTPIDGTSAWNVGDYIIFNGTTWDRLVGGHNPEVFSFNNRTGAINLASGDIVTALGYQPYSAANPNHYLTASDLAATSPVSMFNGRTGAIQLIGDDVTTALGYTPYSSSNPASYITLADVPAPPVTNFNGRTGNIVLGGNDVTQALGYTPYSSSNPAGYISSSQLPTALVISVAGRTGSVTLSASDVSGLARVSITGSYNDIIDKPVIPTRTSDLTNTSGFITAGSVPVQSVNGKTGAIVLTTSNLTNDSGYITTDGAPVRSVNGLVGDVSLPSVGSTLITAALSSLTNDMGFITNTGNVSNALVTVNGITNTLASWIQGLISPVIGHVLNRTGGHILMRDGTMLATRRGT